jgi:hypothetical protein
MELQGAMKKRGFLARIAAMMFTTAEPIGQHQVRGYRTSGREGFAGIAGMSKMARRKLRTGR